MHNPPLTVAFFEHRGAETCAIDVTLLSIAHHVGGDRVLESGPGSLARQMNATFPVI